MARRKKTSPAEDLIDLVALMPWWAGVLLAIIAVTSFCEHRKKLLPFLASRAVIGGSGMIDDQARRHGCKRATATLS